MITHTISILELSWTLIALVGLGFQIALFHRVMDDYIIADHYDGKRLFRRYAAKTSVFIFLGGLLQQVAFVIVGMVAMTQPAIHQRITTANYISGFTFIFSSLLSVGFAAIIYHRRMKIVTMLELEENSKESHE